MINNKARLLGATAALALVLPISHATAARTLSAQRAAALAQPVTVYAHRGGAALAPENTMGAFRQAQAQFGGRGVWLEMDTQLTADGQLVVIHDDTLDRTTTCRGAVNSKTLAQIAPCDASVIFPGWGSFERVPTLRQVLTEGKNAGWRIAVEIKNIPGESNFDPLGTKVAAALVSLVRTVGFPVNRLIVQSFWPLSLDQVHTRNPRIRTLFLTTATLPGAPPGVGFPATTNVTFSTARGYDISAPDVASIDMGPALVRLAHGLGREIVVWTPDTKAQIRASIADGVDGIISNRPDLVYALR